eukprot:CAMPEP_0203957152 /NCGR_PEP_ID=MMETSP0359-20131031/89132_1 /ASSEMBLY_ACC=CAM_ASM_000338 /TAXON_ID=268821 /ORGANISM="Scrippsiella Hangoei, Strain SHTV-5" /LENGTH=30 /DNA_ID= /DNA_START= /DNA_END= /DNA_ORIENTATION=
MSFADGNVATHATLPSRICPRRGGVGSKTA